MTAKIQHVDSSVSKAERIERRVETLAQDIRRTEEEVKASEKRMASLVKEVDRSIVPALREPEAMPFHK